MIDKDYIMLSGPLTKVICYMTRHFPILFCMLFGISEVYLSELFHKEYQTAPKQYIMKLRFTRAKQLLTDSFSTVSEISELCGFRSYIIFA